MSISPRNAVFLDEMGIGTLWKLRNPGTAFEPVDEAASAQPAEDAAMPAAESEWANAQMATVEVQPAARGFTAGRRTTPDAAPVAGRAAVPAAVDDDSMAWFDDVPAAPQAPVLRRVPAQAERPVSDEEIAVMDWPALQAAVASCTRCPLCATRVNAVNGRGPEQAAWMAIATAPTQQDEVEIAPVTGEAGQLLDNMLRAIALKPEADVYVTTLVKCRPRGDDGADRVPTVDELTACRPYLDRELALTGATAAMTFGQFAAKGLMLGPAARGKVMRYGAASLPVVATYHPDDLLRRPEDKAKAWGDLCLARTALVHD